MEPVQPQNKVTPSQPPALTMADGIPKPTNPLILQASSPQQLKDYVEDVKGLLTKLQLFREQALLSFGPFLKPDLAITEVPQDFVSLSQKAQHMLHDLKNSCLSSSAILQEAELNFNPNSNPFIGIKRQRLFQDEHPQKPFKTPKELPQISSMSDSKDLPSELPQERLKLRAARLEHLRKNPPGEKIGPLQDVIQAYNDKFNQETVKAGCAISDSNLSSQYKTIEFYVPSFFKAFIMLKDTPDGSKRNIFKINFFSVSEKNKDFNDSEHHVFRTLTLSSNEQLPFPVNIPDSFSLINSDPLPFILDWIYSHNDLFSAPCAKCNKVLVYTPSSAARFLPPIIRHYNSTTKSFVPYHTHCS